MGSKVGRKTLSKIQVNDLGFMPRVRNRPCISELESSARDLGFLRRSESNRCVPILKM